MVDSISQFLFDVYSALIRLTIDDVVPIGIGLLLLVVIGYSNARHPFDFTTNPHVPDLSGFMSIVVVLLFILILIFGYRQVFPH